MNKTSKKAMLILIISFVSVFLINILHCTVLYYTEPVSYNEPDLNQLNYTFELYNKYCYEKNNQFYIKQITADDVVAHEDDNRLKYIDDTILLFAENGVSYSQTETLISEYDGSICGYIADINMYQAEFDNFTFDELQNICSNIQNSDLIEIAMIDYFEETPESYYDKELPSEDHEYNIRDNEYFMQHINYPDIADYLDAADNVKIGILDGLVDNIDQLDIINSNEYNSNWKNELKDTSYVSHGTHVAGILAGDTTSFAPSICPNADIVSDNALNNSISYWAAAIADMVLRYDIKVINMSIGYNSFITLGASLEGEFELNYINHEADFFEALIRNLKNNDKEFILCIAAGNSQNELINLSNSPVFKYGKKTNLNKWDILNIYTRKPSYCDAKYSLPFNCIDDEDVKNSIIVVGSFGTMSYSSFSNQGERVDILAPGEMIYSFTVDGNYDYASGTSMACPYVSGTAALMFAVNPDLTAKEVKEIIIQSGQNHLKHVNDFSYPVLNVEEAVLNAIKVE